MLSCLCKHNRVRFGLKLQAAAWFMESASFVVREQRDIDFSELIKLLFISTCSTKVVFMSYKPLTAFVAVSLCQHLCLPLSLVRRLHTQQPLQSFLIISLSSTQLFMCPCLWACIHGGGGGGIHMCIPECASEPTCPHVWMRSSYALSCAHSCKYNSCFCSS